MAATLSPKEKAKAQAVFLEALGGGLSPTLSAAKAGVARGTVYRWKDEDEAFAKAWADAWDAGADLMEDEVRRRGVDGWDEPLAYQGIPTGHYVRKFSDVLLIFGLKGRRPEKYKDYQRHEVVGAGGGPVQVMNVRQMVTDLLAKKRIRRQQGDGSPRP